MKRALTNPQRPPGSVFYLGANHRIGDRLRSSMTDCDVRSFGRVSDLTKALKVQRDALLLLDADALPPPGRLSAVISEVEQTSETSLRWVCLASRDDIQLRLEALRAGCLRFFAGVVDISIVATAINQLPAVVEPGGARVLVVDDSEVDARRTAGILEHAGFAVCCLTDELAIIQTMADFEPELIVLDLNMPRASGAELAAIIRDQPPHALTPIIYLSGEADIEAQRHALHLGGDEFLAKPVAARTLLETITKRLQRRRNIEQAMQLDQGQDTVTGLPNRYRFLQWLETKTQDPTVQRPGNGLLFFALEQGDQIAKAIGVGGSDVLMGHAGALLRRLLQAGDEAARFGIYSFMVLVRRDDDAALMGFAEELHRRFGEQSIDLVTARARLSVTIGVGPFDGSPIDALTAVARAESAYRAAEKTAGRHLARYTRIGAATADDAHSAWSRRIEQSLQGEDLPVSYEALLALDDGGRVIERYLCAPALDDLGIARPAGRARLADGPGALAARVDRWTLERAMGAQAERRRSGAHCRLWVRQSMHSIRDKGWLLWLRERRDKLHLRKSRLYLVIGQDDVVANLTVAGAMFPVLKHIQVSICIADYSDDPMARSLLDDYRIGWVMPSQAMVDGNINRLCELVSAAHARQTRVIAGGICDPSGLSRAWSSGADLVHGPFVQSPQSAMCFEFGSSGG